MNKRIKMAAGAGLAALALVVAGGGYYYFHVETDTPEYAIKTIQQSVEEHDTKAFHRAVDLDGVLDSGYSGFVDGVTSAEMTEDTRDAIRNFTKMLRAPMIMSLKSAIDSYIATGELKAEDNAGVFELLEKAGLLNAEVRNVKNIQVNDANKDEVFADVIIFQQELDKEFPIQLVLTRGADNQWQVSRVQNFKEYMEQIALARRAQLDNYLAAAGEINSRHETTIREAEQKYGSILALGSLAQDSTRAELKTLINDVFKKDWEERKQELFNLKVPKDAETLQNLYMRICDTSIDAAQNYAKWMDDKNPATIKHQVQTLTTEAAALAKRMTS